MKRSALSLFFMLGSAAPALAQAPSPAQMGITPTTTPEVLQVLDSTKTWAPLGTVDPTTHIFTPVGGGGISGYATHALLVAGVTTPAGPLTVMQQGFYQAGDGGNAYYSWDAASFCPNGKSGAPSTADGILCILPSDHSAVAAGRFRLQTGRGIDVRQIGMKAVTATSTFDNTPLVQTLMNAIGPSTGFSGGNPANFSGGVNVEFPAVMGQSWTTYWFGSGPFIDSRGATFHCGGQQTAYGGVILGFQAGIDGFIQEAGVYSPDGGWGLSSLENCGVASSGHASGYVSLHSTFTGHASGSSILVSYDRNGQTCVGGTVVAPGLTPMTITSVPGGNTCTAFNVGDSGTFGISAPQTGGSFTPTFTGGSPGTVSGLPTANFPVGSFVTFIGSGALPTGLSKNTPYAIQTSSATAAQLSLDTTTLVPLNFTGSGSGTITADEQMRTDNPDNLIIGIVRLCADPALMSAGTCYTKVPGDGLIVTYYFGAYFPPGPVTTALGTSVGSIAADGTVTLGAGQHFKAGMGSASAVFGSVNADAIVNFSNGDKLTIGNNTFTFLSAWGTSPAAGSVLLGTDFIHSGINLSHAVNGDTPAYPAVGAVYTTPANTPNVESLNAPVAPNYWFGFNAKVGGTTGNFLPSTYTPVGPSAGSWGAAAFTGGSDVQEVALKILAASEAHTVQTLAGNGTVLSTSGARPWNGGDVVWSDAFPFAATIMGEHATSQFTQAGSNNFNAGDVVQAANQTYTFVSSLGSTPGTVLRGVDFPTSAANLVAATNHGPGAGSTYIAATPTSFGAPNCTALTGVFPADVNKINFQSVSWGRPGDVQPSVYTPSGTPAGSFQASTFTMQTLTLDNWVMVTQQLASVTHTAASPGQMWLMPGGVKRRTAAGTKHDSILNWPIGLQESVSSGALIGTAGGHDEYSTHQNNLIGRLVGGNQSGGSISIGEEFANNYLVDIAEGGTIGSSYFGTDTEGHESGHAPYGVLKNCGPGINDSSMFTGYNSSDTPGCGDQTNIYPGTPGGVTQVLVGAGAIPGAPFYGSAGFIGGSGGFSIQYPFTNTCFSFSSAFAMQHPCGGSQWAWAWSDLNKAWELNGGGSERLVSNVMGYVGYAGPFGSSVAFPTGVLLGPTESGGTGANRTLTMGSVSPTVAAHIWGDAQFNTAPVPSSNALLEDAPTFTSTLSEYLWKGGAGFTGDISGTTLNVTSVHSSTPVFTSSGITGVPGSISGLSAVEYPVGASVIFTGSGTLPAGLTLNTQYVIAAASATAATIALPGTPTTPLAFTGSGSGSIVATKSICVGGAVTGTGVAGAPTIVSLPGGATHGCVAGTTGAYVISAGATGGATFTPVFTGGSPGTVSGLTAVNFPLNSYVAFAGGTLPTGLSANKLYLILVASDTAAQLADPTVSPTTPLAFTGSGSGTITADQKMTSSGQTVVSVAACPSPALPTGTVVDDTSHSPPDLLGTQASCTSGVLTLQAASVTQANSGQTIKWMQWYPAGLIASDVGGTTYQIGKQVTIASLPVCASTNVGFGAVSNGQTIAAAGYGVAVSATGTSIRPVFCDGASWTYH